uniref:Uncharacterized protein n=1 Tax=uncultured Poseidoniia archaeon TaxID=1697135 RepID=A0A1B1TBL5_9ARCH|nr:hypothetical protein [uncultured Candidatus Thalassoarchaea sp.]
MSKYIQTKNMFLAMISIIQSEPSFHHLEYDVK